MKQPSSILNTLSKLPAETVELFLEISLFAAVGKIEAVPRERIVTCYKSLCLNRHADQSMLEHFANFSDAEWFKDLIGKVSAEAVSELCSEGSPLRAAHLLTFIAISLEGQRHHVKSSDIMKTLDMIASGITHSNNSSPLTTPHSFITQAHHYSNLIYCAADYDDWIDPVDEQQFVTVMNIVGDFYKRADKPNPHLAKLFPQLRSCPKVLLRIDADILEKQGQDYARAFLSSGWGKSLEDFTIYASIVRQDPALKEVLKGLLPAIGRKCEALSGLSEVRLFVQEIVQRDPELLVAFNARRTQPAPPARHYTPEPPPRP